MRGRKNLTSEEVREFAQAMSNVDFNDPSQRRAVAEVIVKELKDWIEKDDVMNILKVDVQNFLPGQSVQWVTRKGVKAFVHEPGSYAPRSTIANRTTTLMTEMISVNPEIEISQLRAGRYGTIQDIKEMAMQELLSRKYGIIWSTLVGSIASTVTAGTQYYTAANTATAAVKKAALDSGFDYVADKTEVTAIVGRRTALSWLADYSAYNTYGPSESKKSELDSNAYPTTYRGVPVVMLNQYTDGWGTNVITDSNVMILGRDTVKLGVDRPLDFMEEINVDTLMWHIHIFESYGCAVFFPERNARIVWS